MRSNVDEGRLRARNERNLISLLRCVKSSYGLLIGIQTSKCICHLRRRLQAP